MKYIKLFEKYISRIDLRRDLDAYGIKNYTINLRDNDLIVDVVGDVRIYNNGIADHRIKNKLTKIPFKFGEVTGNFRISDNYLESLEGSPYYVGGNFDCESNELKDLIYGPIEVGGSYNCSFNKLESLEGIATEIGGNLFCHDNKLKDIDIVSNIEGDIYCGANNFEIEDHRFRGYCKEIVCSSKSIIISESIRNKYTELGVSDYYSKHKNEYRNPHIEDVKKCLDITIDKVKIGNFLDLGCGNGEVSNYLNSKGFKNFKGLDPHFSEIYKSNFNKECFNLTFEEVSKNGLPESFDTIIASYSIHLCDKSYFDNLLYNISLNCRIFVVISPNKNQNIESYFKKIYSQKIGKSNLIIYQSLLN